MQFGQISLGNKDFFELKAKNCAIKCAQRSLKNVGVAKSVCHLSEFSVSVNVSVNFVSFWLPPKA